MRYRPRHATIRGIFGALAGVGLVASQAIGQNVDLVTLPERDTVQLTIYNSEDITLAKETRQITLKKGANRLQFAWAGTLIDPTSVQLRPLAHAGQIEVADTVFPGQNPEQLIWNIESNYEGQVPVEVSYFTSGLTWQMDYVAISNPGETALDFRGYVRVLNHSGEPYDNAEIRLIVGKINLVEKIAELARRRGGQVPQRSSARYMQDRASALHEAFDDAAERRDKDVSRRIVKQGLSEYFMFAIEGTESVANGWSKRMPAVRADDVAFDIVYRLRAYQYGTRPVRFFLWRNDAEHQLGGSPLPNGLVRLFRSSGNDGLSYLGQQSLNYVPIQAEIEVNLGPDDRIAHRRRAGSTERLNFAFDSRMQHVTGWDQRQDWTDTVRNARARPIRFELRRQLDGDVVLEPRQTASAFDYRTVEFTFVVPPRGEAPIGYRVQTHLGSNARQNRVRITTAR